MAIGDGSADNWEVFQFAKADLVAPQTYDLSRRLRGQAGTDGNMPQVWPTGSLVVLLDTGPRQIELPLSARGLARHYRIGAAARGTDDPTVVHRVEAFQGIGLRPYAPVHLRVAMDDAGDLQMNWVRRTRIDGDSWESVEVPLGEDREIYLIRVIRNDALVRELTVTAPAWAYKVAQRLGDGVTGSFILQVAQMSDRFGHGPFTQFAWNSPPGGE
ncbi:MAG: hypothetical protein U1D06_04695 [Paracoccaceae bacterium]|nr:hypothetical protein [Paracoccaceae bacterium]